MAHDLCELLKKNNIANYIQEETSGFDPSMVMTNAPTDYAVKIKSEDFEEANRLVKQHAENSTEEVEEDYYLFSFTNDELMEVITKADEWSAFDVALAPKVLAKRGRNINDQTIADINEQRFEELKKPETSQTTWIILGYLFAIFGCAAGLFINILGLFIGWHLRNHKKTLPNGEKIYRYNEQDRWHGRIIFYIAIAGLVVIAVGNISILKSLTH